MLECAQWFRATDPKDKIYALLGLARGSDIVVDCGKQVADVYTEATICILYGSERETEFNGLRVLANVKRPADEVDEEWPSWVQKWQDPDPNPIICQLSSYVIDKNSANQEAWIKYSSLVLYTRFTYLSIT